MSVSVYSTYDVLIDVHVSHCSNLTNSTQNVTPLLHVISLDFLLTPFCSNASKSINIIT